MLDNDRENWGYYHFLMPIPALNGFHPHGASPIPYFHNSLFTLHSICQVLLTFYQQVSNLKPFRTVRTLTSEKDLYTEFLRDIYTAEVLQVPALRDFQRTATSEELKELLRIHASETRMQVLRLEELIEELNESLIEEHCRTMESMIEEAENLVQRCGDRKLKDLAITSSLQRIK